MILILTNQAVFVTLSVVMIPPLAPGIFILTLNQADVIGDQSDAVTQNAWFRRAFCAAISGEISILIQTGAESWGRFPVPRIFIKKMYQNANANYILVNTYTGKAFWSHTDKGSYKSFNLQHLLDALEFILNNTYIKFGQQLFLQTKGIPMGGNASPLIADLYLSWLEYQYLSKLVRNKDFNLLHKLKYNSRYIDDIITPNVDNFLEIAKHIYPTEIPLEQTDNDSLHDTFLDLDITVVNNRFCFKVFHKVDLFDFEVISFPFLESNIPQYICYNTFFSQLVRFVLIPLDLQNVFI